MDKEEINALISVRVLKPGNLSYRAVKMDEEVLSERRAYMRQILKNTSLRNASNNDLDNMLIYPVDGFYIVEDANGYEYKIYTGNISYEEIRSRTERSMIPKEYKGKYISDFDWSLYEANITEQAMTVRKFIFEYQKFEEKGMGLYIYSETKGSGKTMLACIILNEISNKYAVNTKFVTSTDYLNMTKRSYSGSDEEINMIRNAKVLVVDDIGTQLNRDWIDSTFYELVNYRYNSRLLTIYTSNIPSDKLKMDNRIIDRIERNSIILKIPEQPIRKIKGTSEKREFMEEMGLIKMPH